MDLNDQLQKVKNKTFIAPDDEKIRETIQKSRDVYLMHEQDRVLSYWEFLWNQFKYTRKRWWVMQLVLLAIACRIIPDMADDFYRVRSIGVIGCLFVVFMIPELWRNKKTDSTQIEAASLYSLRQICSARIMMFGIVDVTLLTMFCIVLRQIGFMPVDVLAQFLLPATVTACICFALLCGSRAYSEMFSLVTCLIWCAAWWAVLMNEHFYTIIIPPVWVALFAMAAGFLAMAVRRTIITTNKIWEVDLV